MAVGLGDVLADATGKEGEERTSDGTNDSSVSVNDGLVRDSVVCTIDVGVVEGASVDESADCVVSGSESIVSLLGTTLEFGRGILEDGGGGGGDVCWTGAPTTTGGPRVV